ncbi:MAG: tRNA (adenosine(37)-N6)-threonylcarbamoyltransferase complex dimerization subunit type 1 TsaB [Actinomycetota bacterium]
MLILGMETSTPQPSVTIGSEQGIIGSCLVSRGVTHGEFLLPAVDFLMRQAGLTYRNLSAVAVGLGPGLFTGMRVGIATAKTVAQALSIPIIGVSSLDLLAFEARYSPRLICPVVDARRGEVFYAFYRQLPGGVSRTSEYLMGSPENLVAEIEGNGADTLLIGNGALVYRRRLEEAKKAEFGTITHAFPRASSLVELAVARLYREDFERLFDLEPMYMRRSDAEINWELRRGP